MRVQSSRLRVQELRTGNTLNWELGTQFVKSIRTLRNDADKIWTAALQAVDAETAVKKFVKRRGGKLRVHNNHYDLEKFGKVWVLGAGKASAPMGQAIEEILGHYLTGGFLATKYGHTLPLNKIEMAESSHPLPDANSIASADRILAMARQVQPGDLVFCLLSGGASSIAVSPADGVDLEAKLECTRLLLNAGASISELNAIRKHLSNIKGGRLAQRLAPAKVLCLILSDVVGDDVSTIASGLLSPDRTTYADCIEILQKLDLLEKIPAAVKNRFELGSSGVLKETPKEKEPFFRKIQTVIIGSNSLACTEAVRMARRLGYHTSPLTSRLEGDTAEAAGFHMSILREVAEESRPLRRPACFISGGETTVRITGNGKGGRNQEFVLHCVRQLAQIPAPCLALSIGTDGTDGPTDAAGAIADNSTLARSMKYGAEFLKECLKNNNSYAFFDRLGDLIFTGPTRTNVMDLHIFLVG
jgi:glycerate 2-kinase